MMDHKTPLLNHTNLIAQNPGGNVIMTIERTNKDHPLI